VKTPQVVIGAGIGDEGKGHFVDYLVAKTKNPVVVRFNGGAQAGHTVVTPDGKRHIFHHFGSGSLVGAETYLSEYFVVNPIIFGSEAKDLNKLDAFIWPLIDRKCIITTPYDMLINQIVEIFRGGNCHGSCGLGVNETITRNEHTDFKFIFKDLYTSHDIKGILDYIQKYWVPYRLQQLGVTHIREDLADFLTDEVIKLNFLKDLNFLVNHSRITNIDYLQGKKIIFEGAQGLMLDEDHPNFPYVTRSKTGLDNVIKICDQLGIEALQVYYLTRSYATRHGAGPLLHETNEKPYKNIIDKTNITNDWQGSLRFGLLDINLLTKNIKKDYDRFRDSYDMSRSLVLNCFDHIDNGIAKYFLDGKMITETDDNLIVDLDDHIEPNTFYVSNGPTRQHITLL